MSSPILVSGLPRRQRTGMIASVLFLLATMVGIIALCVLLFTIINDAFGFVALEYEIAPESLPPSDTPLESLSKSELVEILKQHVSKGLIRRLEFEKPFRRPNGSWCYLSPTIYGASKDIGVTSGIKKRIIL